MAISVDTVYKTVLLILNKEQRGYMTPDEFNKKSLIDMVTTKSDGPSILSMSFSMFTHDVIGLMKEEIGGNMFEFDGKINTDDPNKPSDSIVDASKENLDNLERFAEKIIEKPVEICLKEEVLVEKDV